MWAFDEAESGRAKVSLSGVERMISTDLLMDEDVKIGDWVLVHVGFAMSKIDAAEAAPPWIKLRNSVSSRANWNSLRPLQRIRAPLLALARKFVEESV
ncbi:HypC/HybG/HupF family hydrogenase formation chaperone [Mobiluncus curtisii]|uniref:Hydrogenase isoenzymes formation protein hypC n=1 Tax=Mobiluncus curtisii TaxID=2051 RepID=A0A2X3BFI5_9ACTO|nr:HypC/HybG/HupF family hydrogenase formation chaperone [Mobiluncus curtisii]SQC02362.1 Hydrogenase isoenzymes formation protein hypC [Mobiluncus curtisii]